MPSIFYYWYRQQYFLLAYPLAYINNFNEYCRRTTIVAQSNEKPEDKIPAAHACSPPCSTSCHPRNSAGSGESPPSQRSAHICRRLVIRRPLVLRSKECLHAQRGCACRKWTALHQRPFGSLHKHTLALLAADGRISVAQARN